jgi:hypothetical protein
LNLSGQWQTLGPCGRGAHDTLKVDRLIGLDHDFIVDVKHHVVKLAQGVA